MNLSRRSRVRCIASNLKTQPKPGVCFPTALLHDSTHLFYASKDSTHIRVGLVIFKGLRPPAAGPLFLSLYTFLWWLVTASLPRLVAQCCLVIVGRTLGGPREGQRGPRTILAYIFKYCDCWRLVAGCLLMTGGSSLVAGDLLDFR